MDASLHTAIQVRFGRAHAMGWCACVSRGRQKVLISKSTRKVEWRVCPTADRQHPGLTTAIAKPFLTSFGGRAGRLHSQLLSLGALTPSHVLNIGHLSAPWIVLAACTVSSVLEPWPLVLLSLRPRPSQYFYYSHRRSLPRLTRRRRPRRRGASWPRAPARTWSACGGRGGC